MFQINEMFYVFDIIFVFAFTKVSIQKNNDTKNTIVMIMKTVLKIENSKSIEKIIASKFNTWIFVENVTSTIEKTFYEKKQMFYFMIYIFFSLFFMNTSFDVNFNNFEF